MTFIDVYLDPKPNKLKTTRAWWSLSMERPPPAHFISLPAQNASLYTVRRAEWNWWAQGGERSMFALLRPTRLIQPCIPTIFLASGSSQWPQQLAGLYHHSFLTVNIACRHCAADIFQQLGPQKQNMEKKMSKFIVDFTGECQMWWYKVQHNIMTTHKKNN